ncbi:thiosulfate dehydrogenase [quinone] large subunit [Streptomyces avidinii]|uniref:Thiosulfate dehydrogenase [quinone] large subunit n=1 Tax=Streptomyces avidinii TaxID=1895 RepID=A0ABS4L779_STRAV|nr:thiosulfate dehydrogenase [quinone] large subunit [Streptomyces avidinii]
MNTPSAGLRARASEHALLPLRLFLGVTFVYAGLDKLTDPAFLSATGDGSIGQQMEAVRDAAGVPGLIDLSMTSPVGIGLAIAVGELAVGLGALAGLLTRIAALGGALISLSLWLTMSWSTTPYYFGADLIYLLAWTPLILAGAPTLSLDALLHRRRGATGRGRAASGPASGRAAGPASTPGTSPGGSGRRARGRARARVGP